MAIIIAITPVPVTASEVTPLAVVLLQSPEAQLDRLVMGALADQLPAPDTLTRLLREAIRHRNQIASATTFHRTTLTNKSRSIETQIDRLITAVAQGIDPDASLLKQKPTDLNARGDECVGQAGRPRNHL
jgi:hypothetical protein